MWPELGQSFVALWDEHMLLSGLVSVCGSLLMDEGLVSPILVCGHTLLIFLFPVVASPH